jgi:hypothetical protein
MRIGYAAAEAAATSTSGGGYRGGAGDERDSSGRRRAAAAVDDLRSASGLPVGVRRALRRNKRGEIQPCMLAANIQRMKRNRFLLRPNVSWKD